MANFCCQRNAPSLGLFAKPDQDLAPDVVYAVRMNLWLAENALGEYHAVRSRPVEIMRTSRNWSLL